MKGIRYLFAIVLFVAGCNQKNAKVEGLPNIILILCDDMGYGDLGCYGNTVQKTPNIDRLASEGMRFTDFYAAASVCTPTRASLMTGCYPRRVSLHRDAKDHCVLIPRANKGINLYEVTLPELLKRKGYATGCFGKWHLGDQKVFLPTRHGFDYYYGVPYSNDMQSINRGDPPLPVVRNEIVVEAPTNQDSLTIKCTDELIRFIERNRNKPFFAYLPFNMPHNPVHASAGFRGKSENNIYGDAVEEIDFSVGRIIQFLERSGQDNQTIIIFTSDNGAARQFGGSNLPLTGWKGSNFEGGFRVPMIFWWKGKIEPSTTNDHFATMMDIYPTLAEIINTEIPSDRIIDGESIYRGFVDTGWKGKNNNTFYYYYREQLQAVRQDEWKLFLPLDVLQVKWDEILREGREQKLKLVNLKKDLKEEKDLSSDYPEKVDELMKIAEKARIDIGDGNITGVNQRPAGWVDHPVPLMLNE